MFSSMVFEKKVELTVGPEKCAKNEESVKELSVIVFSKLLKI